MRNERPARTGTTAHLVESIPKGLEDLRGTPNVQYTEDVLVRLTDAATKTLDVTAMYWNLLPDPSGPDERGFTDMQFQKMGAGTGRMLFDALRHAAARGVRIRILESPGFSTPTDGTGPAAPPTVTESHQLHDEYPDQVTVHQVQMGDWYGGAGIMHQKIWIFDRRHLYIGSANMDWKSIEQVKEMGIAVEGSPALAKDATTYFEGWCRFADEQPTTADVFDPAARVTRTVPSWSELVPESARTRTPIHAPASSSIDDPMKLTMDGERAGVFLTGCPPEVRGEGRTYDGDGLVHTIHDARRSVCVSVMDFAPFGLYGRDRSRPSPIEGGEEIPTDTPVWWPSLVDALLAAVLTRKAHVRLLVSSWAHTSDFVEPGLRAIQAAADAGRAGKYTSTGQLEVKQFIVPGWDDTSGKWRTFPGHSRVNHTKYIVTDRRANIGTSNMTWDYFTSTAGSSFNTDHTRIVADLQAVFDRDWASPYAWRLT